MALDRIAVRQVVQTSAATLPIEWQSGYSGYARGAQVGLIQRLNLHDISLLTSLSARDKEPHVIE